MLSILIPVYNFDIRTLVEQLHQQLRDASIDFEIICQDDASELDTAKTNAAIEKLDHTTYKHSDSNLGRIATRQQLANSATYDWLLFIDADVLPKSDTFIQNYINYINSDFQAIYGGFAYKDQPVDQHLSLRWKYGKSKEQVAASKRNKWPYKITISANFLIQKSVFIELNSKITHKGYGYDNFFASLLNQHHIKVLHIDNEVYHLGLEPNAQYLKKVEASVKNLLDLDKANSLSENENSLLLAYKRAKRLKLNGLVSGLFQWFRPSIQRNLLGTKPSILALQFYKLGYICHLDLKA